MWLLSSHGNLLIKNCFFDSGGGKEFCNLAVIKSKRLTDMKSEDYSPNVNNVNKIWGLKQKHI